MKTVKCQMPLCSNKIKVKYPIKDCDDIVCEQCEEQKAVWSRKRQAERKDKCRMKKKLFIWKTANGKKLKLEDIDNIHLINILKFLWRTAEDTCNMEMDACASMSFNGEMAQEAQTHFLLHAKPEEYLPHAYNILYKCAEKRKLSIPADLPYP